MMVPGFVAGATIAGLKPSGRPDLGLVISEGPCTAAGLFTTNRFSGANIGVCRTHLASGSIRALLVHAGQANACTGAVGEKVALESCAAVAKLVGCKPDEVLVGSTGVIGILPDIAKIRAGIQQVALKPEGIEEVGRAMMTTDLRPKSATASVRVGGRKVTLTGIAKGSGMIQPHMATMLSYVFTDARISRALLRRALAWAVNRSFNSLTVDGDMSTSDMAIALASQAAGNAALKESDKDYLKLRDALTDVCVQLARAVAADGEGATRLVTVTVRDAASESEAREVAKAVANSNLVKCAIFGRDPNWGRIACAVGTTRAAFDPARVSIRIGGTAVFSSGAPTKIDKQAVSAYMRDNEEILIEIRLGAGKSSANVYTCDLTDGYIRINADYTT
jgi:glutamate N-acetyltransferase/amino-acid N-acetyltransferase